MGKLMVTGWVFPAVKYLVIITIINFGTEKMVLGGGALINGVFLKAGQVDQISIVIGPYASGDTGIKVTFDTIHAFINQLFKITQVKQLDDDGISASQIGRATGIRKRKINYSIYKSFHQAQLMLILYG